MNDQPTEEARTATNLLVHHSRAESAFLGAAIGDALGWPHEMRATRADKVRPSPQLKYERWTKRSGGRFQSHDEVIGVGEYSDDTQLILAVAMALLRGGTSWWKIFAVEELPFWTLYQRGGGGATKRAANSWLSGHSPWEASKAEDVRRYFAAGGNGVAMRILPHCLRNISAQSFRDLATDIVSDGVTTHGHPRALIGALAYGYGLWTAFRHNGTLAYGQLLEAVRSDFESWSELPDIDRRWPTWHGEADHDGRYAQTWFATVHEQLGLLDTCLEAIDAGAAVVDEEVLQSLGCFNREINGSGTVTASAALFLASRHAADPVEAIRCAALSQGADTDTLASMSGALLGAALGVDWLRAFISDLQDHDAICRIAEAIRCLGDGEADERVRSAINKASLTAFTSRLGEITLPTQIILPNGINGTAEPWKGVTSKGRAFNATGWRLKLENGQTIFVKRLSKSVSGQTNVELPSRSQDAASAPLHLGFRLIVSNILRSVSFYHDVVGLPINKSSAKSVSFGGVLSVVEGIPSDLGGHNISLFIEVANIDSRIRAYQKSQPERECRVEQRRDRIRMQCLDPDGYKLEIYQLLHSEEEASRVLT